MRSGGTDADAAEGGAASGLLELSGSLFSSPFCSSPETISEGTDGKADWHQGVGTDGEAEILTSEALRHSWNAVAAYSAIPDGATQQLSIPKDGGHDDLGSAMEPYSILHMHASSASLQWESSPVFSQQFSLGGGKQEAPYLATQDSLFAQSADGQYDSLAAGGGAGLGFLGAGLPVVAGLPAWDLGMLDRMQAVDVHSGMSGIDQNLSDSEDVSECEDEYLDDEEDEGDDDAPDESDLDAGDENDEDYTSGQELTDDWAGECVILEEGRGCSLQTRSTASRPRASIHSLSILLTFRSPTAERSQPWNTTSHGKYLLYRKLTELRLHACFRAHVCE